jgi:hypothetical protein
MSEVIKRKRSKTPSEKKGPIINKTDFVVGDILDSNAWGKFEIIDYPEARYIKVRFLATGNEYVRQKGEVIRGRVTDRSVINDKVEKDEQFSKFKKDTFDVFMQSWNPTTHHTDTYKLPIFKYSATLGWVYSCFTYVDKYTYDFASKIKWIRSIYVQANLSVDNCKRLDVQYRGRGIYINLHSWVKAMPTRRFGLMTDHRNGVKLDNRSTNLRIANSSQNSANSKAATLTGYKGVKVVKGSTKDKRIKNVVASGWIPEQNKHKFLGKFYTLEEAAKAVDLWNIQTYGEFARLNLSRKIYEEMGILEPKPKKYNLPK